MNKVIEGRRYDTKTAEFVGSAEIHYDSSQSGGIRFWQELLYRKRTGEFFIYRDGGNDCGIKPIGTGEAKKWVSENCDGDTYENLFGEAGEGEKKAICISLTEQESQKIKAYALERKISMSEAIGKLIRKL